MSSKSRVLSWGEGEESCLELLSYWLDWVRGYDRYPLHKGTGHLNISLGTGEGQGLGNQSSGYRHLARPALTLILSVQSFFRGLPLLTLVPTPILHMFSEKRKKGRKREPCPLTKGWGSRQPDCCPLRKRDFQNSKASVLKQQVESWGWTKLQVTLRSQAHLSVGGAWDRRCVHPLGLAQVRSSFHVGSAPMALGWQGCGPPCTVARRCQSGFGS